MSMQRKYLPSFLWLAQLALSLVAPAVALALESSADARARDTEQQMTDDERFGLIHSLMIIVFTTGKRDDRVPAEVPQIAGSVQGVPRLGVPNLLLTDAGLGIANPGGGRKGDTATATFTVRNTGKREGADVPQVYLTDAAGEKRMRLLGFERVEPKPGESRNVTVTADPRLLARFDAAADRWRIAEGSYRVALGKSTSDLVLTTDTRLTPRLSGRGECSNRVA